MVSAAVLDAVCSITRECEPYAIRIKANRPASLEAAIDAAAHDALVALSPSATATALLDASDYSALATLHDGAAKDHGVAVGQQAAAAVRAMRAQDHSSDLMPYTPLGGVGHWRPTPPPFLDALEPGWGRVTHSCSNRATSFVLVRRRHWVAMPMSRTTRRTR
jgi:hypothetical protein